MTCYIITYLRTCFNPDKADQRNKKKPLFIQIYGKTLDGKSVMATKSMSIN